MHFRSALKTRKPSLALAQLQTFDMPERDTSPGAELAPSSTAPEREARGKVPLCDFMNLGGKRKEDGRGCLQGSSSALFRKHLTEQLRAGTDTSWLWANIFPPGIRRRYDLGLDLRIRNLRIEDSFVSKYSCKIYHVDFNDHDKEMDPKSATATAQI